MSRIEFVSEVSEHSRRFINQEMIPHLSSSPISESWSEEQTENYGLGFEVAFY